MRRGGGEEEGGFFHCFFTTLPPLGKLLTTVEDWRYLLQLVKEREEEGEKRGEEEEEEARISLEQLLRVMVDALGPEEAGHLLLEEGVGVEREQVMGRVHRMMVELSALQRSQRFPPSPLLVAGVISPPSPELLCMSSWRSLTSTYGCHAHLPLVLS